MGGKFQSIMVSILSAITAALLVAAAAYEYANGAGGMTLMMLLAALCAVAVCWYTRKPYQPRIGFDAQPGKFRHGDTHGTQSGRY